MTVILTNTKYHAQVQHSPVVNIVQYIHVTVFISYL